ncbi:MAG: PAS domain-containing protein [Vicinamibacterales bacterium]
MSPASSAPAAGNGLLANPRAWTWAAVIGAALVCAALFWMAREHKLVVDRTTDAITRLRAARVDLTQGVLAVTVSTEPGSLHHAEGLTLLTQAAAELESSSSPEVLDKHGPIDGLPDLRASLAAFREQLSRSGRTGTAGDHDLRVAFFDLDRKAARVDGEILAALKEQSERTDRSFSAVLFMAAGLLTVVCAGVLIAGREQARATRALQESERALRDHARNFAALTAAAPTAIHSFRVAPDRTASFSFASARIEDIYGVTPEVLIADPAVPSRVIDPEDRPRLLATTEESRQMLTPWHQEYRVHHPVKGEIWVEAHSMPVRDADGGTTWHGTVTDITVRKQAEMAAQQRLVVEERLSRLAASSPGVVYEFLLRADGTMSFPFASERTTDLFGFPPEALVDDASAALACIHKDDGPRVLEGIRQSARTMAVWSDLFRFQHPTKGTIWAEGRATPIANPDGSVRWHGFLLDVTERRQLEEQFRQSQKMEAIGLLAGGIAHDFNNLLTVIQGHAGALLMAGGQADPVEAAREIERAAERATALTRQLLLFGRKQLMRPAHIDVNEVVAGVTRLLQRVIGEDVSMHAEFAPGLPLIHADQGMIEQVLLNLAVNARDAMPAGGRMEIRTGTGTLDPKAVAPGSDVTAGPYVSIEVRDSGTGIAREVLPRIFEPFFTTKEPGKGTGLGLATAYGIVRQHRGWIGVTSEVGHGTTFTVCLPALSRRVRRPVAQAPAVPRHRPRGTETVLVVEDEAGVRQLAASVLRASGYTVLTAESGVAAIEIFRERENEIALVLTDVVMPEGVTGAELARRLRAERHDLKVLFTSGYTADALSSEQATDDRVHFLQKPFKPEELAAAVRRCLDGEEPVPESGHLSAR